MVATSSPRDENSGVSAISIAEIAQGVEAMPLGKRRNHFEGCP
jgi:hypothetical protein